MKVDEMIESIGVVKGGHVTQLTVSDGERTERYVFPFDSTPPSLVVVSREGLVKLLEEKNTEITQLRYEIEVFVKQPNLPLTFDQLKERVGKPVYRKHAADPTGEWYILLGARETHYANSEVEQEIGLVEDHYVGYNPETVQYYDHE